MDAVHCDVAIIGGASAGLAAALTLGRSGRRTIVFDAGNPRNTPAAHAHNFFTRDGVPPSEILAIGREQLQQYPSVELHRKEVATASAGENIFDITTTTGEQYSVRKIILATGVKDILPEIKGLKELWGNKAVHCPYCHGWEVRDTPVALLGNGDVVYRSAAIISNLNKDLTVLTNGESTISAEHRQGLARNGIAVIETPLSEIIDTSNGIDILFADGTRLQKAAMYIREMSLQFNNELAVQLGCELTEHGSVKVDEMHQSSVPGVFAIGDLMHPFFHQIATAAAGGHKAAAVCNAQLCEEDFERGNSLQQ